MDTDNRLRRLENEIQTLSRAIYKGEAPPPGSFSGGAGAADTEIRLQQLENDIRDLRGKVEEAMYESRQLRGDLERITDDMQFRLDELEGKKSGSGGSMASGSGRQGSYNNAPKRDDEADARDEGQSSGGYQWGTSNGGANSGAGATRQLGSYGETSGSAVDNAANAYENAYSLIKNGNYERAQAEFKAFLEANPDHALSGNAQYWLGETYYVKGQYDEAARAFAEGYQKYPNTSKTADNLLKLGLSLDALGKKDDACIALRQLSKEGVNGSAPVMRRAEQELSRLNC